MIIPSSPLRMVACNQGSAVQEHGSSTWLQTDSIEVQFPSLSPSFFYDLSLLFHFMPESVCPPFSLLMNFYCFVCLFSFPFFASISSEEPARGSCGFVYWLCFGSPANLSLPIPLRRATGVSVGTFNGPILCGSYFVVLFKALKALLKEKLALRVGERKVLGNMPWCSCFHQYPVQTL